MGGAALAGSLPLFLSLPMSFFQEVPLVRLPLLRLLFPCATWCNVGSSCRGFFALVGKTCAFGMNVFSHTMCNDGGLDMSGVWEGVLQ